jgi:hypothetical protein
MYLFLLKIDQFTNFAKQKVSTHTKELGIEFGNCEGDSSDLKEKFFQQHQFKLEGELVNKIDELSDENTQVLKPSLGILKDYYLSIFKNQALG